MTPYYQSPVATLYLGDCLDVVPTLPPESVDLIVTDPPFGEQTHKGARTNSGGALAGNGGTVLVDFASIDVAAITARFAALSRVATRWLVATMEWRHLGTLEAMPPTGWKFIRFGVWTKPDGAPQITGDRPANGWEAIAMLHRDVKGKMRWNGGGKPATYHFGVERSALYPTQKPLALIRRFIADFATPGGTILDPFCGSGTTLVCGIERGHKVIGCDVSTKALDIAIKRIEQTTNQPSLFGSAT